MNELGHRPRTEHIAFAAFANWAEAQFERAMALNLANIERALRNAAPRKRMLDLGCDDGERTLKFAAAASAREVHGVELITAAADTARARGVAITTADLNKPLPLEDKTFDVIVSNQVIEHLTDTDTFASEIRRLLKPGGIVVISTENLASWHNIFALTLGWQPFSLTNVTMRSLGLGNPLAIHRSEEAVRASWQHVKVFSYRALRELFESHGFSIRSIFGAGYYPLPSKLGLLEPRHAAFLTLVGSTP